MEATLEALMSGQVDAVVDPLSKTPVLLSKAQDALRRSEERYRRIVETTHEGIWTVDSACTITFVNNRLAEMLDYTVEEMVGESVFRFLPASGWELAMQRFETSRNGGSGEEQIWLRRREGSELCVLIKHSPIASDDSDVGTLSMMTDRTRQREDEEALRRSEEQYRQIVEATADGILKLDNDAVIVFANRRFAHMLGYALHEMVGVSVFAFMGSDSKATVLKALGRRAQLDITLLHKDGAEVSVNIAGNILSDGAGLPTGHLAVVRDVTERKKLQSQLMVSDRMASVGTLAAGVAHEINNPLAVVMANLELVADGLEQLEAEGAGAKGVTSRDAFSLSDTRASVADAREAAERVRFIVRDLKMFSRSPADETRGPVDVRVVMESSLRMGWNEIRHRGRLVKSYGDVPCVEVNEGRLGQVFLNLLVNAAQSLGEGRAQQNEIRVTTRLDGNRVVVEVGDTGAGIAPKVIGRIFDAFFTTKEVGVGTGLGLAICQRIVTDFGGELTVESAVGKGTTFRVALPIARSSSSASAPIDPLPVAGRRGRILVVDDEPMVASSVMRILAKEHDVTTLLAGAEALAHCAAGERFDLILCDLMMPNMTGMDLHGALALIAPNQARRMIFMTGGAFTETARQFLADSSKESFEKPFDVASLRALVRRLVG